MLNIFAWLNLLTGDLYFLYYKFPGNQMKKLRYMIGLTALTSAALDGKEKKD
jgi:hypothetical protein